MDQSTIDGQLMFANNLIINVSATPEVAAMLEVFGYTPDKLNIGISLYDTANELVLKQKSEYGEQYEATDLLNESRDQLRKMYDRDRAVARVAFKGNRRADESLQLSGRRKQTLSGWLEQVNLFYRNTQDTPEFQASLAGFGITTDRLVEALDLAAETKTRYHQRLKEVGEAQQSTKDRDEALEALAEYVDDLVDIARVALEGKPQYLEMLGLVTE